MSEGSFLDRILHRRRSPQTVAAQNEAATRPEIGGGGQDATRQVELERELGLSSEVKAARRDLAAGKINLEQFDQRAGRK